jgi:DNA-binding Lrp family transcriptional regulator/CheY-like chemotaxis protein
MAKGKKPRIIVVEDEAIVQQDIALTLERLGYDVVGRADNGEDAVKLASKLSPDLMLMDIGLKGRMNGLEAAEKIAATSDVPVVFLTAYADERKLDRAKAVKAFGYIVKPFEEKNLNTAMQMALQKHAEARALASEKDKYQNMYHDALGKQDGTKLDLFDKRIIFELDANARATASAIGKKISLSKGTVVYRLNRLVENGYVGRFYAIVNAPMLGYGYHVVRARLDRITPETEAALEEFAGKEKSIMRMRMLEGTNGVAFVTAHKDAADLHGFLKRLSQAFGSRIVDRSVDSIVKVHKFDKAFLLDERAAEDRPRHGRGSTGMPRMGRVFDMEQGAVQRAKTDRLDESILRLVSKNARMKTADIAKELKVDWKVVKYRLRKMEDAGLLAAYTLSLDAPKFAMQQAQVDINAKDSSQIPAMIGFFSGMNACQLAYETVGSRDLSLDLCVKSGDELNRAMGEFRKRFAEQCVNCDVTRVYRDRVYGFSPAMG